MAWSAISGRTRSVSVIVASVSDAPARQHPPSGGHATASIGCRRVVGWPVTERHWCLGPGPARQLETVEEPGIDHGIG